MESQKGKGPESVAPKGKGAKISTSQNRGTDVSCKEGELGPTATSNKKKEVTADHLQDGKNQVDSKKSNTPTSSSAVAPKLGNSKKTEYKTARRTLDNARHILSVAEKLKSTDKPMDPQKIIWAKGVLSEMDEEKVKSLKRIRSPEVLVAYKKQKTKQLPSSGNVKLNVLDKMPYSEVIKLDLRVCIVDLNDSEWRISLTNFNKLENRFIKILDPDPDSPMQF